MAPEAAPAWAMPRPPGVETEPGPASSLPSSPRIALIRDAYTFSQKSKTMAMLSTLGSPRSLIASLKGTTSEGVLSRQQEILVARYQLWRLFDEPSSSVYARIYSIFMLTVIAVSIINFSVSSYPEDLCGWADSNDIGSDNGRKRECSLKRLENYAVTEEIETVCIMLFTAECVIRLSSALLTLSAHCTMRTLSDSSMLYVYAAALYRYVIRLLCSGAVMPLRKFLIEPFNVLDLLAVSPWYVLTHAH